LIDFIFLIDSICHAQTQYKDNKLDSVAGPKRQRKVVLLHTS